MITKDTIEQRILAYVNDYESSKNPRSFSPSMLGNTLLQNFLIKVFGYQEEKSIGQNTLGSLFHKAMEHCIRDECTLNEQKYIIKMKNGVDLTFIIDMMILDENNLVKSIHDYKLTKIYTGKQIKKDKNHSYNQQMQAYVFGLNQLDLLATPFDGTYLEMFYKDADALLKEPVYEQINVPVNLGIEKTLIQKSDELFSYIDEGEMPPECANEDKWFRKLRNGTTIPSRCQLYCSVSSVCPYYKGETVASALSSW